jgi:hypothetical protein
MRGFSTDPVLLVDDDDLMRAALDYRETVTLAAAEHTSPRSAEPHVRPRPGRPPPAGAYVAR